VPQARPTRYAVLFALSALCIIVSSGVTSIHAPVTGPPTYSLTPLPFISQEGLSINLILSVTNALPSTTYQFTFQVRDPATKVWNSTVQSYTTFPSQTSFGIVIAYPSTSFVKNGRNDLVGQYVGWVNQVSPPSTSNPVAVTPNGFWFILTDKTEYQRTDTVGIRASGYNASEPATIVIRTQTTSTVVLNVTTTASSAGLVTGSWKIPRNAALDNYVISVTGKTTSKNPADAHGFIVRAASMTVSSLSESKTSYQRTETMLFWFTARYPDGQYANTGTALVNLTSTVGKSVSLTATYDSVSQTFNSTYKTFPNNVTGTWTASLPINSYDDGLGNTGPSTAVSASPQLLPATFLITITSKPNFAVNEQIRFNATIQYPDLTTLQSGTVAAFVLFSGGGHNDTMSVFYDSTLNLWVGSYSPNNEPGGLWSVTVAAADSASPANSGKATKTIQLQDQIPVSSFMFTSGTILTSSQAHFNGTSSYDPDGFIVGYSWDFGDGSTGSGSTPTHTYSIAGTYSVKLNVTDNSGSTNLSTQTIIITDRPPVVSLTQSSTTQSSGQPVVITISASDPDGTILNATINWGDGTKDTISGTPTTDSHIYTLASGAPSATYTVTVTVRDNSGNSASTTSGAITIQPSSSNNNSNNVSFPLYYFGILAALLALLLIGGFLALRRHKVTHARLKIDLEAVKAEAGRIENQDFFQSVKDQLKKDKEE
jgi:PKD repeat protein